jgi:hypothetical protein
MTKRPRLELKRRDEHDGSKLATRRRGPTGPRTELGKQRSKLNAIKYGIFSSVMLLGSESKEEFDALVSGLTCTLLMEVPTAAALSTAQPEIVTMPDKVAPDVGVSM